MSFGKATGVATDCDDLVDNIQSFLTSGLGWTSHQSGSDAGVSWYILESGGESTTENIHVSIGGGVKDSTHAAFIVWPHSSYCGVCSMCDQPGAICCCCPINASACIWPGLPGIPVDDSSMTYWLFGDKDMFIVVVRSGSDYYNMCYTGLPERFSSVGNDPYPMLALTGSNQLCITSQSPCCHQSAFPFTNDASTYNFYRDLADSAWTRSAIQQCSSPDSCKGLSLGMLKANDHSPSGFGGGHYLQPLFVGTYGEGMRGYLKYAYQLPRFSLTAEEVITIGGNDYIVFPNTSTYSGESMDRWVAIRNYT